MDLNDDLQQFRVKGKCSILLTNKVAVVSAKNEDEARTKVQEMWGANTRITEVKEYGKTNSAD